MVVRPTGLGHLHEELFVKFYAYAQGATRDTLAVLASQFKTLALFVGLAVREEQEASEEGGSIMLLHFGQSRLHAQRHLRAAPDPQEVKIIDRPLDANFIVQHVFGRGHHRSLIGKGYHGGPTPWPPTH